MPPPGWAASAWRAQEVERLSVARLHVSVVSVCSGLRCVFNQVAFVLLSAESSLYLWSFSRCVLCTRVSVRGFPSCSPDSVLCRTGVFRFSGVSWSVFPLMGHVFGVVSRKVVTTPGSPRFLVSCLPGGCRCAAGTQLCDPESACVRVSSASGPSLQWCPWFGRPVPLSGSGD